MDNIILFWALLKKELIRLRRYFFDTLGMLIALYIVFLLIFLGYRGVAGGSDMYGAGLGNIITGYLLWMLAINAYSTTAHSLYQEAREGTLEQLYMSPYGYTKIIVFRLIVSLAIAPLLYALMILIMTLTTGRHLNLDLISLLPLYLIFTFPIIGIGFSLGGLQLIFKRVESVLQITQFLLIGFIAAPMKFGWTKFLPGSLASDLIRRITVEEIRITQLPLYNILFALGIGLFYMFLGWSIFKACEQKAMKEGRLAHF